MVIRGRGRPKQTWKKQVENEMKKNGLGKEDACDRTYACDCACDRNEYFQTSFGTETGKKNVPISRFE